MAARHDEGFFSARDNLRLFWASDVPDAPKAWVGLVHGYGDHCGRYKGIIGHLAQEGFGVMAFDYRGHGRADGRRAYVEKFGDYVADLEAFWERLRQAAGDRKVFLVLHSHGALVGLKWVMEKRPEGLAGWVISAPYLKLALTPPVTKVLGARLVGAVVPWMPIKTEIALKDLSRDEAWQQETARDPLYLRNVTPRWFNESNRAQGEVTAKAGAAVTWPTYLFAGAEDPIASTPAARAFFDTVAAKDKTVKIYPGMRHECLQEQGKEEVWRDVAGWISAHL
ncbi:MAG TPA: lysophospholipase [Myxococcaceae bacterium]|jgi:alpha-beta hydrolase superfamily lysophospholipase